MQFVKKKAHLKQILFFFINYSDFYVLTNQNVE